MRIAPSSRPATLSPGSDASTPAAAAVKPAAAPSVQTAGVRADLLSHLPGFLRVAAAQVKITVGQLVDKVEGLFHHSNPPAIDTSTAQGRAVATAQTFETQYRVPGMPDVV